MSRRKKIARSLLVLVLLLCGLAVQVYFLRTYPQPILFGDPGAYYIVGQKLQQAVLAWLEGAPLGQAYESIHGYLYFLGVGSLFATIDFLLPEDIPSFRLVLAGFNTLGMLGCFLLARSLSRSFIGGIVALSAATIYPSFALQIGRLFPEAIVGCLWVWAAYFYAEGIRRERGTWLMLSALCLTGGLFVRSQLMTYGSALLLVVLLFSLPVWIRRKVTRRLGVAFALGCIPLMFLWGGIVWAVGDDLNKVEDFGLFSFARQHRYPYGFWMYLESGGWVGPYGLTNNPFYLDLQSAAKSEPALLESRIAQYRFTLKYVLSRPVTSALQLLQNVYRLYDRPANDYQWDYPYSRPVQQVYQRAIMILALAGLAVLTARRIGCAGILFLPSSLAVLHALSFSRARYGQPVMLILIAVAGAFSVCVVRRLRNIQIRRQDIAVLFSLAVLSAMLVLVSEPLRMSFPRLVRALQIGFSFVWLVVFFFFVSRVFARTPRVTLGLTLSFSLLVAVTGADIVKDRQWDEVQTTLGAKVVGVEQELALSAEALARLRSASEAFVVWDLLIPQGGTRNIQVRVNGQRFDGAALIPTMPPMGESTTAGGRNPREYRQWWAVPLQKEMLPRVAPAKVRVRLETEGDPPVTVFGDRFSEQNRWYEGPSFGDWPHRIGAKLEYDGDYRPTVRMRLMSAETKSYLIERDGARREIAGVHRVRLITITSNEGAISWIIDHAPAGRPLIVGLHAYSGDRGEADLVLDGSKVNRFPLHGPDYVEGQPPYLICYRDEPGRQTRYGAYLFTMPPRARAGPVRVEVRFRSGMSERPMFFSIDPRAEETDWLQLAKECRLYEGRTMLTGPVSITGAPRNSYPEDTGRWRVLEVF